MGCGQSKIENEEIVTRCKERKHHMKEAVSARNAFAAAHSLYTMALKNTGAALSDYSHGEVQFSSSSTSSTSSAPVSHSYNNDLPPPPPLPDFVPPPPLQRAATMPEFSIPKPNLSQSDPIIEEEEEEDDDDDDDNEFADTNRNNSHGGLRHLTTRSGSSVKSSSRDIEAEVPIPPPSPPRTPPLDRDRDREAPPHPRPENNGMSWDYFFPTMENVPGPTLAEVDEEERIEREEIERRAFEERARRAAEAERKAKEEEEKAKAKAKAEAKAAEIMMQQQQQPQVLAVAEVVKKSRPVGSVGDGKRVGKSGGGGSVNLEKIFKDLDDCFLQASQSAHDVSKMLEANRLHYHSNFADNRGHIDHSARVMRVITWNRSFRGLPNADNGDDDLESEEHETHATVLDKMLAWEKKLYDEVKAGELMKLEYQKKVAALNKLKKRGTNTASLERTKAAVSHLHTRYIVDMQSMDSTVSEINRLRDEQLYPKLVALVEGMATMWETMQKHHQTQSQIVQALRYLDSSNSPKETSEHHHERTVQLWAVVQDWHSQFEKLVSQQKRYINELNSWLRLNLIPIDNNLKEKVSSPQRPQSPPIQRLLHAWHDLLEKLPEELARSAIQSFAAVVNTIREYQEEELKLRDKCEETRKELNRKIRQFEDWYNKQMQRRTPPDEMDPERAVDKEHIADRQLAVEMLKKRLEEEEEAYRKQCVQVRDKSLTSLKTRMPELFRSISDFSFACSNMYKNLLSISKAQKSNERS